MVRSPRRLPHVIVAAVALLAVGVVVAGVQLGTVGLPSAGARDPSPVLTRPAAQIRAPGEFAGGVLLGATADDFAPLDLQTAEPFPASASGPQSTPAPGTPTGPGRGGGASSPPPNPPSPTQPGPVEQVVTIVDETVGPLPVIGDLVDAVEPPVDGVARDADSLVVPVANTVTGTVSALLR